MTPASLTDTLTAGFERHWKVENDWGTWCCRCLLPWPCSDHERAEVALSLVAQIRSEAQAIADRHHEGDFYDSYHERRDCAVCPQVYFPCLDRQHADRILALTGDTEEAT